ncbi:MAG TPA: hypothetical protein VFX49_13475, partial [Chloroflexota bacterium]|nr:hypothetical protein [Chloroflexota bacterium]
YGAVRDHNWGTPPPHFTRYKVEARDDSFTARFTAEHVSGDVDLVWEGTIDGSAGGTIAFTFDATARATFLSNRIGLYVLHPMEAAGSQVEVRHTDGSTERGTFPIDVSPHQPFFDVAALRQELAPGVTVEIGFEGEVFEMEDQRNWTDASYKTYSTPLALPYPVEVPAGKKVWQRVTLRVTGAPPARSVNEQPEEPVVVRVGERHIGSLPPIGLQIASHSQPLGEREIDLLAPLNLDHLWLTLHLTRVDWEARLLAAHEQGQALRAPLEIEAICGDSGAGLDALAATLAARRIPVSAVHVYPKSGVVTTEAVLRPARMAFRAARVREPIGGGSRADFVNINRATLPLEAMDFVAFAVNPQVHTFDDASMVETLAAQTVVLENAKRITHGLPVRVGPVTLRQRLNPAAAAAPEAAPGQIPSNADPRQSAPFAAAWMLGSIRRLLGAKAITLFETTGPLGLIDAGQPTPAYGVLAAVCERGQDDVLPTETSAHTVEALALRGPDGTRLLIANLSDQAQRVRIDGLPLANTQLTLPPYATTILDC